MSRINDMVDNRRRHRRPLPLTVGRSPAGPETSWQRAFATVNLLAGPCVTYVASCLDAIRSDLSLTRIESRILGETASHPGRNGMTAMHYS
jgi:hypothetical protein